MSTTRWSKEQADDWYHHRPWMVGCNFIPSTAVNQLEMWQAETFDPAAIERELGWAADIGFNTVRVYLHDLLWQADDGGFTRRIDHYLNIAAGHGISTIFVLFDDCWRDDPHLGLQPAPVPGVHNSGWVQSPGRNLVTDEKAWGRLERYVREAVGAFGRDGRVLFWDLYNEPGNGGLGAKSLPLLERAFAWAREADPAQPLTSGIWCEDPAICAHQAELSDIITFHDYNDAATLAARIAELREYGRPLVCTEYMARTRGSRFETHLPVFKREDVGCCNWGLVSGRTQTIYPWGSPAGSPEPQIWFHDIFRGDGTPFDPAEIQTIRRHTGKSRP
ncbi:MAG: cellulase family glycosylhydrolase [Patescibacteria group bacterium]